MYILKHLPEDFHVEELASFTPSSDGWFLIVKVTKRSRNSEEVAQLLAERLGIERTAVGYAGAKDRNAVTTQHFSLAGVGEERMRGLALPNITLEFVGRAKEALGLGALAGNRFTIVVRNLDGTEDLALPAAVPNYFDEQRFSTHNVAIGEALVRKRFAPACAIIQESDRQHGSQVASYLEEHTGDAVGAVMRVPKQLLRMYLHAYQSSLWNRALDSYIHAHSTQVRVLSYSQGTLAFPGVDAVLPNVAIPIPGFDMQTPSEEVRAMLERVLADAQVSPRDFIIRQLPNLSLEGASRDAVMAVTDYVVGGFEEDDAFPGKKKTTLRFTLGKGSYATMLVKAVLGEPGVQSSAAASH